MVTAHLLIFVNESYDLFPAATKEQAVWKIFSDEKRQRKGQEFSMENLVICERLRRLRSVMEQKGIDFYMMPTADFHNSEYVNAYFKVREFFCNFTGSNGTLVVWKDGAGLWSDVRYFIQAENELAETGVTLFGLL